MKDKRNYLKIACLIEVIYITCNIIYNLFFVKKTDTVIATIFLGLTSLIVTYILYKESKKEINYLKNNKLKILFCSIWLFLEPIIPGILGFMFLSSLKEKKQMLLPKTGDIKKTKSTYVKSIIVIFIFILMTFILPRFNFFNHIPIYIPYLIILFFAIIFNYKELKNNFIIFIKNVKTYFPFIIKRYFIMLGVMLIVAVPIVIINNGKTSNNQQAINDMFNKIPFFMLLLTTLYAPLTEEVVFRLSLSKLINNKKFFIIISGILFGALHVLNDITSFSQLLYIFQYSTLGICLAKGYNDSKNIFVSISIHFIQNFMAALLILLLF